MLLLKELLDIPMYPMVAIYPDSGCDPSKEADEYPVTRDLEIKDCSLNKSGYTRL